MVSVLVINRNLTLGEKARVLRLAYNLRQTDIACIARCSPSDVSDFERGIHVSDSVRTRILEVLELEGDDA